VHADARKIQAVPRLIHKWLMLLSEFTRKYNTFLSLTRIDCDDSFIQRLAFVQQLPKIPRSGLAGSLIFGKPPYGNLRSSLKSTNCRTRLTMCDCVFPWCFLANSAASPLAFPPSPDDFKCEGSALLVAIVICVVTSRMSEGWIRCESDV
jgi:hypothetical protein